MKISILLLFIMPLFLFSCDSEIRKEFTVSNKTTFQYNLKICGDEEGATINKQASHYEISELVRDSSTGFCVYYVYKPDPGYVGTDYLEIKTNTGSDGASNGRTGSVKFDFNVVD